MHRVRLLSIAGAAGLIVFTLGIAVGHSWPRAPAEHADESWRERYAHLNPDVVCCGAKTAVDKKSYRYFQSDLADALKKLEGIEASIYFRDLQRGPTMGVDEHIEFTPASLLKVPIMIAYYKLAETNPAVLDTMLTLRTQGGETATTTDTARHVQYNTPYTVAALIEIMITYSDNAAKDLLERHLASITSEGDDLLRQTYVSLGLAFSGGAHNDYVTVKQYSTLFLMLYNTSYLSAEMSEKALGLLTRSEFSLGLAAGLPTEVSVAHKYGAEKFGDTYQLHDCGIVYFPENPYLLCVMTRGKDQTRLAPVIASISKTIYEEFNARAKNGKSN